MNRIFTKCAAALMLAALCVPLQGRTKDPVKHAAELHKKIISIDTHTDTAVEMYRGKNPDSLQVNLKKMRQGGMDAVFFATYIGQKQRDEATLAQKTEYAEKVIANFKQYAEEHSDEMGIAYSADDIRRLKKEGKLIGIMAIENGYALGKDIANVKKFYDMGVRYITLSHNNNNDICDAAVTRDDPKYGFRKGPEWHGLSPFGYQVVAEMNRLGIMIDISHTSAETVADCLRASKAPVIATHSCCDAIKHHSRNLTDDQIKAIAEKGGLIQVTTYWDFLGESEADANLKRYCDHVEHVRELVGVEHVGFGSDFDGGGEMIDVRDVSQIRNITVELINRGWSDEQIGLFWGGNVLRVMESVAKTAAEIQAGNK